MGHTFIKLGWPTNGCQSTQTIQYNGKSVCNPSSSRDMRASVAWRFFCDNQAVVNVWQSKNPKDNKLADLARWLFLLAAQRLSYHVSLTHVPCHTNEIADALSRQQIQRFRLLTPEAKEQPASTPAWLAQL